MPSRVLLRERLQRYRQIGQAIVKYGFGMVLDRTHLARWLRLPTRAGPFSSESAPARVRQMLEELGPTFIKLGQILSTRPDLLPFAYLQELEKLQDQVAPLPGETIQQVVEEQLQARYDRHFSSFTRE
ncbi:MAG TPA: AarF/ABC1/UbiB kinase family protein, partial [bacterium]|nr:AarF/ABC1/UbiB kinase family protein [bacterium]